MDDRISAGDIERFGYCPLNWQRSKEGTKGVGGQAGVRLHDEKADTAADVGRIQNEASHSLQTAFLLALVAISGAILTIEILYLQVQAALYWVMVMGSVMWLAGSLYLLVFHLWWNQRATAMGRDARLVSGTVAYVDRQKERPEELESSLLPLRGRPDYVVQRNGQWVPVEVKTGRPPRRPYDSHVLQIAAYCHLVGDKYDARPAFGVLSYRDREFEVPFTEDLENELVRTLLRIQIAQRTGEAHRNHGSRGRCAGCARRQGCPERLDVVARSRTARA